jgi:hypothetical protein
VPDEHFSGIRGQSAFKAKVDIVSEHAESEVEDFNQQGVSVEEVSISFPKKAKRMATQMIAPVKPIEIVKTSPPVRGDFNVEEIITKIDEKVLEKR